MAKTWFTSDWHFGHDREFVWKARGFNSIEEMNEAIIERHNSVVAPEDDVYVLGDLMLGDNSVGIECIKRLNGKIHIVFGNHDTNTRKKLYEELPNAEVLGYAAVIKIGKKSFYLSHYPALTANFDEPHPTVNLYGHTHQNNNFYEDRPFMFHVGADSHNCYPVEIETIRTLIKEKVDECVSYL